MAAKIRISKELRLVIFAVSGLIILGLLAIRQLPDDNLHLVFCDVGQGDATLIVTPSGKQILVDGGAGGRVLSCLSNHLPFWDRTIEMVVLTHPQLDHFGGLIEVFKRFEIDNLVYTKAENQTAEFEAWQEVVEDEDVKIIIAKRGQKIRLGDDLAAKVLWPIDGNFELGVPTDLNNTSVVVRIEKERFCALLAGDIGEDVERVMLSLGGVGKCLVLKVPHHGSKTGLAQNFLTAIDPQIAVIPVGKNNRFGHPTGEILGKLEKAGAQILRTDIDGEIEIISNGEWFKIKTGN